MTDKLLDILVIGYGNPGRLDDGLGPAFVDVVEAMAIPHARCDADYQLTVEDAVDLQGADVVLFVDADATCDEPFYLRPVEPCNDVSFSTHHVTAEAVVAMAEEMFDAHPAAYMLGIRGHEFNEFGYGLSEAAQANLAAALKFITPMLRSGQFTVTGPAQAPTRPLS
jgi:hydrogenase maturation protease